MAAGAPLIKTAAAGKRIGAYGLPTELLGHIKLYDLLRLLAGAPHTFRLSSFVPRFAKRKQVFVWGRSDCPCAVKRDRTGAPEAIGQAATLWLGRRGSNPQYGSQSPVCYRYTTSHRLYDAKGRRLAGLAFLIWGGRWDLNPRHPEPQSGALPTELHPPY